MLSHNQQQSSFVIFVLLCALAGKSFGSPLQLFKANHLLFDAIANDATTTEESTTTHTVETTEESTSTTTSSSPPEATKSNGPSSEELKQQLFHQFDNDSNDALSFEEFAQFHFVTWKLPNHATKRLLHSPTLTGMFDDADRDGDDQLDLQEFVAFLDDPTTSFKVSSLIFEAMDENEDGRVVFEEMVDFKAYQQGLAYQERNQLIQDPQMHILFDWFDVNGNGYIDREEFKRPWGPIGGIISTVSTESPPTTSSSTVSASTVESTTDSSSSSTERSTEIPDRREELMRQLFNFADVDGNGQLGINEFTEGWTKALGFFRPQHDNENEEMRKSKMLQSKVFFLMDLDNSGHLSMEEFLQGFLWNPDKIDSQLLLFVLLDANQDGQIIFGEFIELVGELFELDEQEKAKLSDSRRFREAFARMDTNENGTLDFEEFMDAIGHVEVPTSHKAMALFRTLAKPF